ncbi:MAG TPA: hypothetical protein VFH27_02150 [Longimicrobiaceae bacterium]|nr:hypothetical protein [Longimicrobiaceae bacterium]
MHSISRSTLLVLSLLMAATSAPAAAQQAAGPVVSLQVRGVRLTEGNASGVSAGVEVRSPGSTYVFGGLDARVFRLQDSVPEWRGPAGKRIYMLPGRVPGLRVGVGQRVALGGATAGARAYVGQQGFAGVAPLAGAGVSLGRDPWAVTVDGVTRRAAAFTLGTPASPGLPAPVTPAGTRWLPSLEVGLRWDAGTLGQSSSGAGRGIASDRLERPAIGGLAGGVIGVAAGALVALPSLMKCEGDEACLLPVFPAMAIGGSVGIPVGVHVAEGRRGNVYLSTAASLGVAALGWAGIGYAGDSGDPPVAITMLVPIAQIAVSTAIERHTARRRSR